MPMRFSLLTTLLLCLLNLQAQVISESDILSRARKVGGRMQVVYRSPNRRMAVCQSAHRPGFALVNTTEQGPELLGYSLTGDFHKAMENPGFQQIIQALSINAGAPVSPSFVSSDYPAAVAPLLTDLWDQFAPYNLQTPLIGGEHCAVGCVALAMAQVMRYWGFYQPTGVDSYTYIDSLGCKQELTVRFPQQGYDFQHMVDSYLPDHDDQPQLDAMNRLLADCGIAVNMKYGVSSSGARSIRQPIALANFFGYDKGLQMYFRDFFPYSEWEQMLMEELSHGRPVLMSATSPSLSHAFCCDGYDEDRLFHLNLGMSGDADGYYYLPYLTPKQPKWYDVDSPEGGMNLLQSVTVGIQPPSLVETPHVQHPFFAFSGLSASVSKASRNECLSVVTQELSNTGWNMLDGRVALLLKRDQQVVSVLAEYPHPFLLEEVDDTVYTDTLSFVIPADVPVGTYRVVPAFAQRSDGVSSPAWTEARTSVGTPNYLLAHVGEQTVELLPDSQRTAHLSLVDYQFPDTVVQSTYPQFSFTLQNHQMEYCGRMYVLFEPVDKPGTYRRIQTEGLTLNADEVTRRYFHQTKVPIPLGDYYLRLCYDVNLFNDSLVWLSSEPLKVISVVSPTNAVSAPSAPPAEECYDLYGRSVPLPGKRGIYITRRQGAIRKTLKSK